MVLRISGAFSQHAVEQPQDRAHDESAFFVFRRTVVFKLPGVFEENRCQRGREGDGKDE